jgi:hypothetical protein
LESQKTSSPLQSQLVEIIEKAIATRFDFELPVFDASLVRLQSATVDLTKRLNTLEQLLSNAIRAKAALDRRVTLLRMEHQSKWDEAISGKNKRPTFDTYATGKERAAEANLATFESMRRLAQVEEDQAYANEAVDIVRLHYYGLDKVRQDIKKRLDGMQNDYYSVS